MAGALIVSGGEKGRDMLAEVLRGMQMEITSACCGGGEARRLLIENDYELAVINSPLSDEFGYELASDAAMQTGAGVVLIVKAELADEISVKVEDAGVFVVSKPLNRALLFSAIKMACAAHRRLNALQQKNTQLQQKIDDIRLVDRAKCALIQHRQLTEPQAHKYIEREAMDSRKTRREVAESILISCEGKI